MSGPRVGIVRLVQPRTNALSVHQTFCQAIRELVKPVQDVVFFHGAPAGMSARISPGSRMPLFNAAQVGEVA